MILGRDSKRIHKKEKKLLVFSPHHQLSVVDDVQTENSSSYAGVDDSPRITLHEKSCDNSDDSEYEKDNEKAAAPTRHINFRRETEHRQKENNQRRQPHSYQHLK